MTHSKDILSPYTVLDLLPGIVSNRTIVVVVVTDVIVVSASGLNEENGIEDFDRGTELEPEHLDEVGLTEKEEGLTVDFFFDESVKDLVAVQHPDARQRRHEVRHLSRRPIS